MSTDLLTAAMAGNPVLVNGVLCQFAVLPDGMDPCGKFWFLSKEEVERKIAQDGMHSIKGPEYVLNAYYCFGCDGWHIGHTRKKA